MVTLVYSGLQFNRRVFVELSGVVVRCWWNRFNIEQIKLESCGTGTAVTPEVVALVSPGFYCDVGDVSSIKCTNSSKFELPVCSMHNGALSTYIHSLVTSVPYSFSRLYVREHLICHSFFVIFICHSFSHQHFVILFHLVDTTIDLKRQIWAHFAVDG